MIKKTNLVITFKELASLVSLVLVGVLFSFYVVKFPEDTLVSNFINYNIIVKVLYEHMSIVMISCFFAIIVALPLGIILTRTRFSKYRAKVLGIISIGQTIPSLALIGLFVAFMGVGKNIAILALSIYSLLPILNNTIVGICGVNFSIKEAARGMGMLPWRILYKIELPIAAPLIIAGVRTAFIINIGSAVLAAFAAGGGLGDFIIAGTSVNRWQILMLGTLLCSVLALFTDIIFGILERRVAV